MKKRNQEQEVEAIRAQLAELESAVELARLAFNEPEKFMAEAHRLLKEGFTIEQLRERFGLPPESN